MEVLLSANTFEYINVFFVFTVPPDFSYLPESSFIRAAIDFAIESGKKGKKELECNA